MINPMIIGIILFIAFDLFILFYIFWKKSRRKFSPKDLFFIFKEWNKILILNQTNPKNAIMEADKLFDHSLSLKGYQGSLGEKLKKSAKLFSDLNGIWFAHKLRNSIAHELNFNPDRKETDTALFHFKKALCDLGLKI